MTQKQPMELGLPSKRVMPGLVPGIHAPGIHVLAAIKPERQLSRKDLDGRDKPGHDEKLSGDSQGDPPPHTNL
jgi:hypothetical protein